MLQMDMLSRPCSTDFLRTSHCQSQGSPQLHRQSKSLLVQVQVQELVQELVKVKATAMEQVVEPVRVLALETALDRRLPKPGTQ